MRDILMFIPIIGIAYRPNRPEDFGRKRDFWWIYHTFVTFGIIVYFATQGLPDLGSSTSNKF